MDYGYIRVSKREQRPDRQLSGMRSVCDEVFIEKCSAANVKRPVFQGLLKKLRPGDRLYVWDLDRAFRNTEDALFYERYFREAGVKFIVMNAVVDTSTADGRYNYIMDAAAGERERGKISERTREGLKEARKRGSRLGRPPKLTKRQILNAHAKIKNEDAAIQDMAAKFGVHPWTLSRNIKKLVRA